MRTAVRRWDRLVVGAWSTRRAVLAGEVEPKQRSAALRWAVPCSRVRSAGGRRRRRCAKHNVCAATRADSSTAMMLPHAVQQCAGADVACVEARAWRRWPEGGRLRLRSASARRHVPRSRPLLPRLAPLGGVRPQVWRPAPATQHSASRWTACSLARSADILCDDGPRPDVRTALRRWMIGCGGRAASVVLCSRARSRRNRGRRRCAGPCRARE